MTFTSVPGADATGANVNHLPPGIQHAGYVTGSGDVPWSAAQFAADPKAVRIDQTPAHTPWDATADVDDFENGAVQLAELAPRIRLRQSAWKQGTRPGQRWPAVYASASNLTAVVNALISGGITNGVGLWVAHYGIGQAEAQAMVQNASGPFPVIAVQYDDTGDGGTYDQDEFSKEWLDNVSAAAHTGLYWHDFDGNTPLGTVARDRGYSTTFAWLEAQKEFQSKNAERMVTEAVPPKGAQWVSVNP